MRLYTEKGEFTLPEDFTLDMQRNNPVFSDEGSASATFTLPATKENLEAAGRPDRLSRQNSFINNVECIVQFGTFQLQTSLIITSCNKDEIGCCITFDEGGLYADYKDYTLKSILKYRKKFSSAFSIATLAGMVEQNMEDDRGIEGDFAYFPAKIELMEGFDISLNEYEDLSDEYGIAFGKIIYKARSYKYGDTTINVPDGYGLTAFPFLHHIVSAIFTSIAGYEIVRNDFTAEPYNHLVLLHPCADLMCKGNIAYKDLVPDITLSEFITWLQDKFGAYVFVKGKKEISIVILDNLITSRPAFNLTPYLDDDMTMSIPERKSIDIEVGTSLAANPTDTETGFREKYGNPATVSTLPSAEGIYLIAHTGGLWQVVKNGNLYQQVFLGYNNFPFSGSSWYKTQVDAKKAEDQIPGCLYFRLYHPSSIMLHLGPALHYNTAIEGEEEEQSHPLMVAWTYYDGSHWRSSVTGIETTGEVLYPGLNPKGLFELCWKNYNTALLNLAPDAEVSVHIPADVLRSMDIMSPVLVGRNRAIIKSYNYTISKDGITSGKCSLWMLPNIEYPIEA